MHLVHPAVPVVEIAYHADPHGIGRPYCKVNAGYALDGHRMRSQLFVDIITDPGRKLLLLLHSNLCVKGIRIIEFLGFSLFVYGFHLVLRYLLSRNQHRKKAGFIFQFHLVFFPVLCSQDLSLCSSRKKALDQNALLCHPWSQDLFRLVFLRINNCLNLRPVHHII